MGSKISIVILVFCFIFCTACFSRKEESASDPAWHQKRSANAPEVTSVSCKDNAVNIQWKEMENVRTYYLDFGRAALQSENSSISIDIDNSTWPLDMTGSDPMELHIYAVDGNDICSDMTVLTISLPRAWLHFVFKDQANTVIKEEDAGSTLPAGRQTMNIIDGTSISIGALTLVEIPSGWRTESADLSRVLQEGDNTIEITVHP